MAILISVSASIVSCDFGRIRADGRPVQEVWGMESPQVRIQATSSPLKADREIPVLSAPEVFAVYVPSRLDQSRDLLIGEHWIYFRLKDGEWFIESQREPDLPATDPATDDDLRVLRFLQGMSDAVTPWKETSRP